MKTLLLSILIAVGILFKAQAQTGFQANFKVSLPDQSANHIFDQHPGLDYIYLTYKSDTATVAGFYYHANQGASIQKERFYLNFEGDRYLLDKRYPKFNLPKPAKMQMKILSGVKHLGDSVTYYDLTTKIIRDSIIHHFNYFALPGGTYRYYGSRENTRVINSSKSPGFETLIDTVYTLHPKFKGNIAELQKRLGQSLKLWKPIAVTDSALLIFGFVERNGSLGNLRLEYGKTSPFSNKILEFIQQEASLWWPRSENFRKIKDLTKIFVRLKPDESFAVSIL
jgi:hypothetical protein